MAYEGYDLSALLKRKRSESKMSLREFSEYLGISHAYLDKLEKGVDPRSGKAVTPTIDTLAKIADALHLSAKDFLALCGYADKEWDGEQKVPYEGT